MFEFFFEWGIVEWIFVIVFVLVGILIGLVLRPPRKNQVTKLLPNDRRGFDFDIEEENAFSLVCKPRKGMPPQRFIKFEPGYVIDTGSKLRGRHVTRFFGVEGTAYTTKVASVKKKIPIKDFLIGLWGESFYNQIPSEYREQVDISEVPITVAFEDVKTPKDFRSVSEEDIKSEEDRQAAQTFWEGKKISERRGWVDYLFIAGFGFGIALALQILGILRI